MDNTVFGKIEFKTGWKKKIAYSFLGEKKEIVLKIKAYRKEDGITEEQESTYKAYLKNEDQITKSINETLTNYTENAREQYNPKTLLIGRDGACALLCDDKNNPDDGIAVTIYPEISVIAQDDYL